MKGSKLKKYIGLLYISPWLIGTAIFTVYPFMASFILGFMDYRLTGAPKFVGLANYIRMFNDKLFWISLFATFKFVLLSVPARLAFALLIAIVLNASLKGINLYRTIYYIPSILGGNIAIAVLWRFLFQRYGLINQMLGIFGLPPVLWFSTEWGALITISTLRVWQFGSAMVIFLAGLRDIPQEYYEAAAIDGANKRQIFWKITMPLLSPVIFFNLVMGMIHAFQEFNAPFMITGGGPMYRTYLFSMMIYDNAFKLYNMGYASALSWFLFVIIAAFAAIIFRSSKYWVYYTS
ncbi:carbohydrate ABC transporter permease [Pseudothermotoga thermarum]|uniref:Carbohydrate ABC transporter membrane protein 1, CUT1 family n=1 Tax=Pseudothermotoga thermarum DSM 5069 TaxID=688269 RepID=F7YW03_9THEM|nr:sugar ABC transporter permease [Pseudothermotoga thermarum]AEH50490.1 carbohydrate ABC transporter membrane protein 1, CUT1 family [Pseudothermotoga thermarum DSM 5069]